MSTSISVRSSLVNAEQTSRKPARKPAAPAAAQVQRQKRQWKQLFRYESGEQDKEIQRDEQPAKAPVTRASLARFWHFVQPHSKWVWLLCTLTLINQSMTVVLPLAIGTTIDTILPQHAHDMLNIVAIALAVFVILRAMLLYVEREIAFLVGSLIVRDVRTRLHEHMQKMSLRFLEDYQVGRIVSRIMGDTEAIRNLLLSGFISSASNAVRFIFIAGTLLWIDWQLTLVSCCTLPLFMYGFWRNIGRLRPAYKELSEDGSCLWAKASETFSAVRVVKTYGGEKRSDLGFTSRVHSILRKSLLIVRTHHVIVIIWEMSVWLGIVALIWFGGNRVMEGALSAGQLVAFYGLLGLLHGPIAELIAVSGTVQQAMASIERIGEILDEKPEIADKPDAVEAGSVKGEVNFEDVSFTYVEKEKRNASGTGSQQRTEAARGTLGKGSQPQPETAAQFEAPKRTATLKNISFSVKAGECVALVGPSGSGKSTISNLLARFYDVESGSIKVDGVDLRDFRLQSYRKNLAIVLQDNFLFRGTIRDNIRYSRPDASEDEIIRAAKMAGAWEFISASQEGLGGLCGERGVKLSGGQKQRISIARAILANPRILILDEATSALDSQAEAQIQSALDTLMEGRTTFIIAHRLSTIVNADKIIVMDQGQIVEAGTHEELLLREGRYYALFMEQYGRIRFSGRTADAIGSWRQRSGLPDHGITADSPVFNGLAKTQAHLNPTPVAAPVRG